MTHDKSDDLVSRARKLSDLHRGISDSFDDHVRGPAAMGQKDHEDTERVITALIAENERLREALRESADEIDTYIRQEYPLDHPVHERYRQRDFAANTARAALRKEGEA